MKRIEFIAPVESMRGNLSGNQKLVYAENDNPAYDAPIGRNYARNYRPSFIGAKVAKSGKKYFAVKTKSAAGISTLSKKAMSLLGGTAAVIMAILADGARKAAIQNILEYQIQHGVITSDTSLRKFMDSVIRPALSAKAQTIAFRGGTGTTPVIVNNPWVSGGTEPSITQFIKQEILVKFWGELANSPINYKVNGRKGIGHVGDVFNTDYFNGTDNILGLMPGEISVEGQMVRAVCLPYDATAVPAELSALTKDGAVVLVGNAIENVAYVTEDMPHYDD